MKFKDYPYQRIDFIQTIKDAEVLLNQMKDANVFLKQKEAIIDFNILIKRVHTMATLAEVRHTMDTSDDYYREEKEYYDRNMPEFEKSLLLYKKTLVESPYREDLIKTWGKQIIVNAEISMKAYSELIVEESKEENLLSSKYQVLLAESLIEFRGERYNLPGIMKFLQDPDRTVRKDAYESLSDYFNEKEQDFDQLFDQLVDVRTRMSDKLGYRNFIELGYARMQRTDYSETQIEALRKQVLQWIVPICQDLRDCQCERIGLEKLYFYDQSFYYPDGNPMPKGSESELISYADSMYHDMSNETSEFFDFMKKHELMDLTSRKGKAMGGYCTFLPDFDSPFIFSNFNGTSADVDVLTHEAGHALQMYQSQSYDLYDYMHPSSETAEIHSMTMEYFAYPYMDMFFGEEADKYRKKHLTEALLFIPYGVCVDHFQHEIYRNPSMTYEQRRTLWRDLEKIYLPYIDYDGNEEMEKGVYWYRQLHIFMYPFYYIDYVIASMHALQYYVWMKEDRGSAWESYLRLCSLGGSRSYLELTKEVGLENIFDSDALDQIMASLQDELLKSQ